jgi:type VI secretion system secreted protein VgrG
MIIPKIIFGIDGKEISHFTKISLKQSINNHHEFSISKPYSILEQPMAHTMQNAQKCLGKVVHIRLSPSNSFLGIVTNVSYEKELGDVGSLIVISGYSKTILLESGKKLHSWENQNLRDIILDIIQTAAGDDLQHKIDPEFTLRTEYQTQYLESDFRYLQRLAKQYNEWLFYNGEKLFFGKPKIETTPIKLVYNKDLYTLKILVQAKPNQYSGYTYNESVDRLYQAQTNDDIAQGLPTLGKEAFEASQKLYRTPSYEFGQFSTGADAYFESILRNKQESTAADGNYITATSKNAQLRIGAVITITSEQVKDKLDVYKQGLDSTKTHYKTSEIGTYIITEINHTALDAGEYENSFKALPAGIKKLPEPDVPMPEAQQQRAVVVANNDPKGNGRIRVQLLWQKKRQARTPWLYVLTPDAGSSNNVNKNRGWVTIPEVGDHVMVGFRYNDPNRPYVTGSLFHGKIGDGGGEENNIKSFSSKSGNKLELNDKEGSMYLTDHGTANMKFDGSGNTTTNANNTNTINVGSTNTINVGAKKDTPAQSVFEMDEEGNIAMTGTKKLTITIGNSSFTMHKDGTIAVNGKDITVNGGSTISLNATPKEGGTGSIDISSTGGDITMSNDQNINIKGGIEVKLT